MKKVYFLLILTILLFACEELYAAKSSNVCIVENCPRAEKSFRNKADYYNHVLKVCLACPWCDIPIIFNTLNEQVIHLQIEHCKDITLIDVSEVWSKKSIKSADKKIVVFVCESCSFINVRQDLAYKHGEKPCLYSKAFGSGRIYSYRFNQDRAQKELLQSEALEFNISRKDQTFEVPDSLGEFQFEWSPRSDRELLFDV